ncbi:hypothetical protein B0A54_01058 [Friedmanniomyces endolithicus]|uniref:ABC transporter domain-containing protein n=1 Tax=Friedmanniomyces endolithicus TaxID=329885 RepID=A0A4U0VJG7_9PEZI|nr:hypothetical protein B0A54_01058 [Friedmanniomyces endolithicus]
MINEFHNRDYSCSAFVPAYGDLTLQQQVCSAIGSQPGQNYVNGDAYINSGFQYYNAHKWRNVGIIIGFTIFLMFLYLAATELISSKKSKGEVLVFRRGHTPASLKEKSRDVETADAGANGAPLEKKESYVEASNIIQRQTAIFSWKVRSSRTAPFRHPAHVPRREKLEYVNEVIKLLDMEEYAVIVGVPGEGLNVEQRKRLTIGVELSAKPELLLFLDEPTSGLDSQTSWAICDLMEKLKNSGQAILCTIHQPSAMLFQRFDRLLFLAKGGKTVYFGEVGANSKVLSSYFERHGSHKCPRDANPAEWMLEVIGAAPGSHTDIDWHETWRGSKEYAGVHAELEKMKSSERPQEASPQPGKVDKESYREFAAPFGVQMREVTYRVFQQYWRTPSYIYSKAALCLFSSLFIGFAFYKAPLTQQGLQNQMFSIFMLFTIFGQLTQQIMPHFVTQRALYEARERPSKAYGWRAFMFANIIVELPWNTLMAVIIFFCFYYPIGLYNNAVPTNEVHLRGFQFFLFVWQFLLFTSTFTNMMIAGIADAETGGNLANLLFSLSLIFCGVLASPTTLPRFWIFIDTNIFLRAVSASYAHVWRDYGILWVYIIVNACGALFFYWLARVPKKAKKAKKE